MIRVIPAVLALALICGNSCACEGGVEDWSRGYLALKAVRGHFDGGDWTASVDRWDGDKHRAMRCLAGHAVDTAAAADQVLRWMGQPDEVLRCPSAECAALKVEWTGARSEPAKSSWQLWIYHWRGPHDRLALAIADDRVARSGWAYVRE